MKPMVIGIFFFIGLSVRAMDTSIKVHTICPTSFYATGCSKTWGCLLDCPGNSTCWHFEPRAPFTFSEYSWILKQNNAALYPYFLQERLREKELLGCVWLLINQ